MLNHREQLQAIRTFPQLVRYLHDELDWPISQNKFEDITFPYTPEELGIDAKIAPRIQEIRRLRPLSVHQPWGVFFVKFEPKRLPVIVMRRILNAVAIKNRASAANADKITWASDDLLFISNYGEEENRQITFAHFTQNKLKKDLPTLKVLGWDNRDTALHLDHVSENLSKYLSWPVDEKDVEAWRKSWRSAFTVAHREGIDTSKKLSIKLAGLARNIRYRINSVLEYETENGPITKLMNAFKEALVHDLDNDGFADMYAQTIAYGLLSARIANPTDRTTDDSTVAMPVTNPFLKELMETFIDVGGRERKKGNSIRLDFDELGVSEVIDLLDAANMEAVVRDFGDKNPLEDPVTHFYEQFFADYDNSERFKRGVFYTPRPVVSFIVRSVDDLLRTEFGLEYGLADTTTWGEMVERIDGLVIPEGATPDQAFVQILDPATGTGTFLVEVIDLVHKTMLKKWRAEGHGAKIIQQLWNEYVPKHLLPRVYGYELMMAPYAIAHMKIGLKLYETGYAFESSERARVYLTNSLEPLLDFSGTLAFAIPALAHESEAVNFIKRSQRFTIVLGNPPYSGVSSNNSEYAIRSVDAYKFVDGHSLGEKKLWLQDDYVKFIRLAQTIIDTSTIGILGYITNHGYLDNPTFRGMRQSLLNTFQRRNLIDLHGNTKKKEVSPDGLSDKNVFDIQQGVAIGLFTCKGSLANMDLVAMRRDLFGSREEKYQTLASKSLASMSYTLLRPNSPFYLFAFQDQANRDEYEEMPLLSEMTHNHSVGVVTARDQLTIAFTPEEIWERVNRFSLLEEEEARSEFNLRPDVRDWKVAYAQRDLREDPLEKSKILPILYRPFDIRFTYYTGRIKGFIGQPAAAIMSNMIEHDNIGLMTTRKIEVGDFGHAICANSMTESHSISLKEVNYLFPLWIYPASDDLLLPTSRVPNFTKHYMADLAESLGLQYGSQDRNITRLEPDQIFHYIYAILYSKNYRNRYSEFLRVDFPRIPFISNLDLFYSLVKMGAKLRALHLLESPNTEDPNTETIGAGEFKIEKVSYSDQTVWINRSQTIGFSGVPEAVWNFKFGSYQVCEKWLKDRGPKKGLSGRVLTNEDIEHYQKIIVAISETVRIMAEIDEVIEAHGGWPGAFKTD